MACVSPKLLLVIGGLWKIYNRWAVFEGYVFSNYLRAEGFDRVVAQATCSVHHSGPVAGLPAIFCHMRPIEFWINGARRLWSDAKSYKCQEEGKKNELCGSLHQIILSSSEAVMPEQWNI